MSKELALNLLDWHGGQGSAIYSVGSRMLAISDGYKDVHPIKYEDIQNAQFELQNCHNVKANKLINDLEAYWFQGE